MSEDYLGAMNGRMRDELKNTITQLGLEFRLMTQFTSFVAVEEISVADGGTMRRIDVPVDVPEGMDRDMLRGGGGAGGPTGLFTTYSIVKLNQLGYFTVQPTPQLAGKGGNVRPSGGG